jgi:hypothetical protein
MKSLNKALLLFLTGCLLMGTSCGKNTNSSGDASQSETQPFTLSTQGLVTRAPENVPHNETRTDGTADIHVTIPEISISLADLKANDYTVPVYIELDQNSGINYAEWGAEFDSRCTVTSDAFDDNVRFDVVCSINDEKHFFWTAWASANTNPHTGNLVLLNVKLPEDAAAGDTFPITYASYSLADKPHVWNNTETDWVKSGVVGWKDGGITVTE